MAKHLGLLSAFRFRVAGFAGLGFARHLQASTPRPLVFVFRDLREKKSFGLLVAGFRVMGLKDLSKSALLKQPRPLMIFQIGTNNWQRQGEFAPGSGILHASFHQTMRPGLERGGPRSQG